MGRDDPMVPVVVLIAALVGVNACRSASTQPSPGASVDSAAVLSGKDACHPPLASACLDGKRPTWDETIARLRKGTEEMRPCVPVNPCEPAVAGTCGRYRFIGSHDGFGSWTYYFDDAGMMIGAARTTDVIDRPCGGTFKYGKVIECSQVVVEKVCYQ